MRTPARQQQEAGARWPRRDLILVAAAAILVRVLFFAEYRSSPFFDFIHLDPRYYRDWALQIAAGDWLGKEVFEQSPLYPYLLAIYFVVAGQDLTALRLGQFGLGALTAVLTCVLGRRFFGRAAGIAAGIGAALYGPFLFYEGQVMKEFLTPLLSVSMLILFYRAMERGRRGRWLHAGSGLCIGLAALVRDNFLLLLPILGAYLLAARGESAGRGARFSAGRWIDAGALAAGAFAALLPVLWRNHHVAGEYVLTTSGGGEVFYIGNGPHANGAYVPPPWVRATPRFEHEDFRVRAREISGRGLTRSEASRFWWREGLRTILDEPARWIRLEIRKAALFLNDHELPDNYSYYSFRRFSWVLTLAPTFGWIAALAAPGVIASAPRWRELMPLYLAGAGYMGSVMLFFNFARFRLPFIPILLVLAGHGAVVLWRGAAGLLGARRRGSADEAGAEAEGAPREALGGPPTGASAGRPWRRFAIHAAGFLIVTALTRIDLHTAAEEPFQDRLHMGAAYRQGGMLAEAEGVLRQAIRDAEAVLAGRGWRPGMPSVPGGISFAYSLHAAHRDLAAVLLDQKRTDEAIAEMNAAIPFDPNDADLFQTLGGTYRSKGDLGAAAGAYRRGLAVKPDSFTMRFDLATALYESGDARSALEELLRARDLNPSLAGLDLADWHYGMGTVLMAIPGREAEAIGHFREGLRINPEHPQSGEVERLISSRGSSGSS